MALWQTTAKVTKGKYLFFGVVGSIYMYVLVEADQLHSCTFKSKSKMLRVIYTFTGACI